MSCARRDVDLQQLQIIDNDQLHVLLRFEPARLRPQLENAETGAVIDEDFCFGQLRGRGGQAWENRARLEIRRALFVNSRARENKAGAGQAVGCSSPG